MSLFDFSPIREPCRELGVELTADVCRRLEDYGRLLAQWNETMNLTAITDPNEVVWKHFYDSLLFFKACQPAQGASVMDVGTGAGFPGLVLLCVRPDLKLTLLDSQNKRITFLEAVLDATGLCAQTVHGRAEELGQRPAYRERYDIVTARAVAPLNRLDEYCLPFVRPGGVFVALKGPSGPEELALASNGIAVLGGGETTLLTETVPPDMTRTVITVKKVSHTPTKYPRNAGKMTKQPL